MNFTKIALAAVVTMAAAQAQAATVYLTGASATAANYRSALSNLCTTASPAGFAVVITNAADTNKFAVRCQVSSTNTAARNFKGLTGIDAVTFNVGGGSFTAVSTSIGNDTAQFVNPADATGNTLTAARKSDGGFLDIDAAAFSASDYGNAGLATAPATEAASFSQVFGVAVSPALYTALQTAQGLAGCGIDSLTAACQPSITKAQYVTIVNDSLNTAKQDINPILNVPTDDVTVCRRVSTSGTQASSNEYFLKGYVGGDGPVGGAAAAADAANFASAVTGLTSYDVQEGSTTGNARTCLSGAKYRLGVLSLENYPDLTTRVGGQRADRKWRFVKIAGVAAFNSATNSTDTARAGQYEFWFTSQKFGANANGTNVVNAIDAALESLNLPGLFSNADSLAKRDSNASPIRFD